MKKPCFTCTKATRGKKHFIHTFIHIAATKGENGINVQVTCFFGTLYRVLQCCISLDTVFWNTGTVGKNGFFFTLNAERQLETNKKITYVKWDYNGIA